MVPTFASNLFRLILVYFRSSGNLGPFARFNLLTHIFNFNITISVFCST